MRGFGSCWNDTLGLQTPLTTLTLESERREFLRHDAASGFGEQRTFRRERRHLVDILPNGNIAITDPGDVALVEIAHLD